MSSTFGRPHASFLILLEVGLLYEIVVPEAAQGHDISPFATKSIPDRQGTHRAWTQAVPEPSSENIREYVGMGTPKS